MANEMMTARQQQFKQLLHMLVMNDQMGWQQCYEQAVEKDAEALLELANFVAQHLEEDVLWLLEEAVQYGNVAAYYELGNYYYEQAETDAELQQVFSYYMKAANAGVADAMNNLADMYLNGEGTKLDEQQASVWFTKAAELHVPEAMFTLGIMYEQGLGVLKSEQQAYKLYEQSARAGYEEAEYRLGMIHFEGLLGQQRNDVRAFEWFMRAAKQYQLDAVFNVAYCYEHGRGVARDVSKAIIFYKQASLLGDHEAKLCLANLYEGIDIEQAKKWRQLAEE